MEFILGFCYLIFSRAHWKASVINFGQEKNFVGWFNLIMSSLFAALLLIQLGF